MSENISSVSSTFDDFNLDEFVREFRRNVAVKDRRWRTKTYRSAFIGAEAVEWMLSSGVAGTREDAVKLGLMMQEQGVIEHIVRDHDFKDEHLFYKFIDDSERGGVPRHPEAGRLVSWGDFLSTSASKDTGAALNATLPNPALELSVDGASDIRHGVDSLFWPKDEANVRLLDNVHPAGWIPPAGDGVYNLLVIGAGAGGLVTSSGAAGVGAKVALIEANTLGGDCLNVGCVPSKALIHSANLAHAVRNTTALKENGIYIDGSIKIDFGKTMKRVRNIRADISKNDSAHRYTRKLGVDVYFGYAKFTSENTVIVNDKTLTFKKAVIATGGTPIVPNIPGLRDLHEESITDGAQDKPEKVAVMTNETFFNITNLPKRLAVIGTGVIGMELGQAMQRMGSSVTIFGRSGKVLPKEDPDLAAIVRDQMEQDGVKFQLNVKEYKGVKATDKINGQGYKEMVFETREDGLDKEYYFDAVLVAVGRRPNVTGMDLEKANVKYDLKTGLVVNDSLQTTNSRIYGVGDVCSDYKFTHAADFMARMVIKNALFLGKEKFSRLLIPYATFTSPEIAHVGLYEKDMKEKGIEYKTFEKEFNDNDRAICDSETTGLVRIHTDKKSDAILGASIVASDAANMINEITLAIQSKTGLGSLASVIHPYPTTAEAIRQAGDLFNRTRLTTPVKQVLRGVVKLQ